MATPDRQAVQGLQMVQRQGRTQTAFANSKQASPGVVRQDGSKLLEDLMSVAGGVSKVATMVMNDQVEEDKIRQYDRSLKGLMPSEDATTGGVRAHMLVNLQNRTNEVSQQLQADAKNFQGTDDEWEEHVITSQRAIREETALNYPELTGDRNTGKMITMALMEQQPKVFAARAGAKIEQAQVERTNALQSRILSLTDGQSGEQLVTSLKGLEMDARTMQISQPEYEGMVVSMAMEKAAIGDSSLIDATKHLKDANGVSLYQRNGKLMAAEISADRTQASLNQVELFEKKNGAEQALMSGDLNWDEFLKVAENHNSVTGGTAWSESELSSLYNKRAKAQAESATTAQLMARGEEDSPLGLQDISQKQRTDYAEGLRDLSTQLADQEIAATGATGEGAEAIRGKYEQQRLMKMAKNAIQDPVAKERFESLLMMAPDNLKDMKQEPEAMQTLLRTRDSLPFESRRSVLGDKEWAFTENYDRATQMGYNPGQAIAFAQNASRGEKLPQGTIKELGKMSDDVVSQVASGSWLTLGDNMSDLGKDLMSQEAQQIAWAMKQAGHSNETIEKQMKSYLEGQYTQTAKGFFTSGVLVKGVQSVSELGKSIGANGVDSAAALSQYLDNNEEALLDASGMERKDLYFDIDQKKGTFVIRAGSGRVPVTMPQSLKDIDGQALLRQTYDKAKAERDKLNEEAKKSGYGDAMKENYKNLQGSFKPGQDVTASAVGKRGITDFLMSPAFASGQDLPGNFEFGYARNNMSFYDYVAKQENNANVGFNSTAGSYEPYKDAHGESVGFGHFITPKERLNGYIEVDGNKIPFTKGNSQVTPDIARKLLVQDMKAHVPSTSDWKTPFDQLHPAVQRGIMDLSYNLGKGGIANAPKAEAAFKAGRITDGFINMLSTASEGGKRSPGLLVRRAGAYNLANESSGLPKITQVETNEDGSMRVKFSGEMSSAFVSKDIAGQIGKDGWMTVYPAKKDSLVAGARPGTISIK